MFIDINKMFCTCKTNLFKDAMPVSFDQNCLHLTYYHTLEVNPTPINMNNCHIQLFRHVKILQKKMTLLIKSGLQIWLFIYDWTLQTL